MVRHEKPLYAQPLRINRIFVPAMPEVGKRLMYKNAGPTTY